MGGKSEPIYDFNEVEIEYIWDVINRSPRNGIILNLIGVMNHNGFGIPKNIHEAIKYYKMAIEFKNLTAIMNLALIYENEVEFYGTNKAEKYYKSLLDIIQSCDNLEYSEIIADNVIYVTHCITVRSSVAGNVDSVIINKLREIGGELNKYIFRKHTEIKNIFKLYYELNKIITETNIYKSKILDLIITKIHIAVEIDRNVFLSVANKYKKIYNYNINNRAKIILLLTSGAQDGKSCVFGIDNNIIHAVVSLL